MSQSLNSLTEQMLNLYNGDESKCLEDFRTLINESSGKKIESATITPPPKLYTQEEVDKLMEEKQLKINQFQERVSKEILSELHKPEDMSCIMEDIDEDKYTNNELLDLNIKLTEKLGGFWDCGDPTPPNYDKIMDGLYENMCSRKELEDLIVEIKKKIKEYKQDERDKLKGDLQLNECVSIEMNGAFFGNGIISKLNRTRCQVMLVNGGFANVDYCDIKKIEWDMSIGDKVNVYCDKGRDGLFEGEGYISDFTNYKGGQAKIKMTTGNDTGKDLYLNMTHLTKI